MREGEHLPHDNNTNGVMRKAEQGNAVSITDAYTNEKDISISVDDNQGTSRSYALRRLAKECPDLHAQCLTGELTAHAAMVQAGLRTRPPSRKLTPLDYLRRYWRQVAPDDRLRFLCEMLTPNERRALQCGCEDRVV